MELQQLTEQEQMIIKRLDEWNKWVIFRNCAPFTDCTIKINDTQIDNAKDLDVVMLIYNSVEYSHNSIIPQKH